ncbi:hypothetical protein CS527_02265 [Bacillus sp. Y-01]|nr:hypothetical protein CS527_02265 [Bacillus sp. Y-01]
MEDKVVVTHIFRSKGKYKKTTDKNGYTYRSMVNALFRKGINGINFRDQLRHIAVNKLEINEESNIYETTFS